MQREGVTKKGKNASLMSFFFFSQTDFPLNRFMDFRTISVMCPGMLKYGA